MPDARDYTAFHESDDATSARESARKADFESCPILADFLATMLQDLQYQEVDEACEAEREEGDTGTIYTLQEDIYQRCKVYCEAFYRDNREAIDEALALEPGSVGLRYYRGDYTLGRIGSTLYMLAVGHGVAFTDDGDAECLGRLNAATRKHRLEFWFDHESGQVSMSG